MKEIEITKNDLFIDLKKDKLPISFYLIRKSLLEAVKEIKPLLQGNVLDLACGIMPYKNFLMNDKIIRYIGIDLEPTEYHNIVKPDYYWDGKKIPLDDASVDFVLATEFLEHYFDTSLILNEINRVLKPGGIFFFTVPSIWPLHEVPYDYHRFTPFALAEHLKNTGFISWDIKPLGGFNYHSAISLALRFEKISSTKRKFVKPFFNIVVKLLIKNDNKKIAFENGQLYSGLYGFVTK
jgi:SAM-dependent methyltransferase